jgi:hypothetical protein
VLLLLLLFLVLTACGPEEPITSLEDPSSLPAVDEASHPPFSPDPVVGPEFREFRRRAEFLPRRLVSVAPSVEALEAALEEGEEAVFALLELDPETAERDYRELRREALRLTELHPRLRTEVDRFLRSGAPPCESWALVDLVRRLHEEDGRTRPSVAKETRVVCAQLPYIASLVLCTASGNALVYLACSVVAMCNHCSGGFVDSICGG